jgi:hypothetical protein
MSAIPEDAAPAPLDRRRKKSATAREAEADGHVTIEACGITLLVPVKGKVPLKAYMAFKDGDELGGTELLLGAEQWAAFLGADPTMDDYNAIGAQLNELAGNL